MDISLKWCGSRQHLFYLQKGFYSRIYIAIFSNKTVGIEYLHNITLYLKVTLFAQMEYLIEHVTKNVYKRKDIRIQ